MDRLQAMHVFTRIVEMNSFSRAADSLNLPHATATTIIKNLESHLHVRLMQRTTRRLNLTPEGAQYYERCVRILAEIEETELALSNTARGPRGQLRIEMPPSLGRVIVMPQLFDFRKSYPDIDLTVGLGDRPVDLIQEGVDCAIRVGVLEDSTLVARRLGDLQTITAASPEYIEQFGMPMSLEDLQHHTAVHYFSARTGRVVDFTFVDGTETTEVKIKGGIAVNDAEAYVSCGIHGVGLIQPPKFMVQNQLQTGELVEVLPHAKPRAMPISAVYPHNRHLAAKVRVFVEWASELFETCPLMSNDVDAKKCAEVKATSKGASSQPRTSRQETQEIIA
jgi:LysR family transcriptional regulator for bpeEF and oprC